MILQSGQDKTVHRRKETTLERKQSGFWVGIEKLFLVLYTTLSSFQRETIQILGFLCQGTGQSGPDLAPASICTGVNETA